MERNHLTNTRFSDLLKTRYRDTVFKRLWKWFIWDSFGFYLFSRTLPRILNRRLLSVTKNIFRIIVYDHLQSVCSKRFSISAIIYCSITSKESLTVKHYKAIIGWSDAEFNKMYHFTNTLKLVGSRF